MNRIRVGILGATGTVGQRFVQLLQGHPWFEITALAASSASAGRPYGEICRWKVSAEMPPTVRDMMVEECAPGLDCDLVFSALPGEVAGPIEEDLAAAGYFVSSNAKNHRLDPDVPLLIPEVNPDHIQIISHQRRQRGWERGFIVTSPNCSVTQLVLALKPLLDSFGLSTVMVTTMQAISGAGYPGLPSWDILDNVIPHIGGEEEKVETEPLKLLGRLEGHGFQPAPMAISAQCNRVNTVEGHLEAVSVRLARKAETTNPTVGAVVEALRSFTALPQELDLPSAPRRPIVVREEEDRPQPRYDRDEQGGMAVVVGRVRECPVLDYKFVILGHNTVRGAAGGSILNAELLMAKGYLRNQ
ncbi:MAG: aspartate-semialdehyde dehydrogenase [Anaerolineales bacterium]|nr:MAG: aspartate-semialdehyde dehydrogenase [Anaerolineales bacterium]